MHVPTYWAIGCRVLIALCTRTFFQPDEYFQALEPAYHAVFGYGHLTWEWLAPNPIRSILYPALNIPIYWLLKATNLADAGRLGDWLLIVCPKVLHGALAACTDIYIAELALNVLGKQHASLAMLLSLTSMFNALALSRSLSNSLETSLTTIAFAFYPWDASDKLSPHLLFNRPKLRKFIVFSALACLVRPTNVIIWIYLYANLIYAVRKYPKVALAIISDALIIGSAALSAMVFSDSLYYGRLTFTPLNFLKANASSISLFYGNNSHHYYLSQAIPILCTTALPFTLHGIWLTIRTRDKRDTSPKTMLITVIWTITIYSLAGHKEWRFIHPILPLLYIFAAKSIVDLSYEPVRVSSKSSKPSGKDTKSEGRITRWRPKASPAERTFLHNLFDLPDIPTKYLRILLATLPVSFYIVTLYCSGPISAMSYIRSIPRHELKHTSIGILMPCHSTPGYAYLNRPELANGALWALGCEPPIENQDLSTYKDQTKLFFDAPRKYLETYFPARVNRSFPYSPFPASLPGAPSPPTSSKSRQPEYPWRHEWPTHLIFFGDLLRQEGVKSLLEEKGYKEVWKAGRSWEGEDERKGGVKVWQWSSDGT